MNKKLISICIVLSLICALFPNISFSAKTSNDLWTTYSSGSASADNTNGAVSLVVDTAAGENGTSRAKFETGQYNELICFSTIFSISGTEANNFYPDRTIYLATNSDNLSAIKNASVLTCISGKDMLAGPEYTDMQTPVSYDTKHMMCAEINLIEENAKFWLDGEYVGSTSIDIPENLISGDMCIVFENTYPTNKKEARFSKFNIYDTCYSTSITPEISSYTTDNINYYIDLGTIATNAKINIDTDKKYTSEFMGGGFNITFENAFDENEECIINLTDIQTLDGEFHNIEYTLNEKIYEFNIPASGTYSRDELSSFSVYTSDEFEKVTYYIDGQYYTDTTAPYEIDLSDLPYGIYEISAAACAENGKLLTTSTEITICEKNVDTKYNYSFDSFETGDVSVNSSNRVTDAGDLFYSTCDGGYIKCEGVGDHEKAIVFGREVKDARATSFLAACMSVANAKLRFESDIYFFDNYASTTLAARGTDSSGATAFLENVLFSPNGDKMGVTAYDKDRAVAIADLEIQKWHKLIYEFDLTSQKYSLEINGEKLAGDFGFKTELVSLNNMVRFYNTYKAEAVSKMGIDNIGLSIVTESMIPIPQIMKQGNDFISVGFQGTMDKLDGNVRVLKDEHEVEIISWNQSAKNLDIQFKNPIMQTGKYDIEFITKSSEIKFKGYFEVEKDSADITNISVLGSNGKCSVEFMKNVDDSTENVVYIVNRYSSGELRDTYISEDNKKNVLIENIDYSDGDLIKAFALNLSSDAAPFSDAMAQVTLFSK